jgi:hypothetical protein
MKAGQSYPSQVLTYVMSATRSRSGASGVNWRFTRSRAGGMRSVCERRVVRAFLRQLPHSKSPASRISLVIFFREHLTPSVLSSQ